MKKIITEYMTTTTHKADVEEKIIREGFDFLDRRAAWSDLIATAFDDVEREEVEKEIVPKNNSRRLWQYTAAVGLTLLAAIGVWYFNQPSPIKPAPKPPIQQANQGDKSQLVAELDVEKLLSKSVDDFQATITRKGSQDIDNWQADFQVGKYTTVIQTLESIGKSRTVEQTYFLAQAYLKIDPKNTLKAQPLFKLVSTANSDNAHDALWSYALICLLHQPNEEAKKALDDVIEKSNAHKAEAQQLRLKLK
jgi:hypothetical protein